MRKYWYFWPAFCLAMVLLGHNMVLAQGPTVDGLVTVQGAGTVDETASQLQSAIQERGLTVIATVDHAANAEGVGQTLRPTKLLIFGNPNLGTQLMQNQQSVGIDLPQKLLVWEDETGQVNVSYNAAQYLQNRHDLTGLEEVLGTIANALGGLSSTTMPATETEATPLAESPPATLPVSGGDDNFHAWWFIGGGLLLAGVGWLLRRRQGWAKLLILVATPLLLTTLSQPDATAQETNGLVSVDSPHSVEETVNRLQATMADRGLNVMTTIDHAANAENVGRELRPTQLIIFGNPNLGTQLMQSSQTVAIDLPQKFLVWEDADGQVHMTYNDPQYLAQRHGITDRADVLITTSNALNGLAEAAGTP